MGWPDSDGGIWEAVRFHSNLAALAIDPTVHVPLKVLLIRTPRRTFFCFIMHHAVADGGGSISFIQKFISCYEDIFYQRKPADHQDARYEDISLPAIRFRRTTYHPAFLSLTLDIVPSFASNPR